MLIEVLLPLPLERLFTYRVTQEDQERLRFGLRVAVPFGKKRMLTGLIVGIGVPEPEAYAPRETYDILDDEPIISPNHWAYWNWIAFYYMCTPGEVMRYALPGPLLPGSETRFQWNPEEGTQPSELTDEEYLLWEALQKEPSLDLSSIRSILQVRNPIRWLEGLCTSGKILSQEQVRERYKPKKKRYLAWNPARSAQEVSRIVNGEGRAPKQREALLHFISLLGTDKDWIAISELTRKEGLTGSVYRALIQKDILQEKWMEQERLKSVFPPKIDFNPDKGQAGLPESGLLRQLRYSKKPVLFRSADQGAKYEELGPLIEQVLARGEQVLYIVPELAYLSRAEESLTRFQDRIVVNHPRFNSMERVEFWRKCASNIGPFLLLGTRASLFLPLSGLGLLILDESHDSSYKQFDPAPRYHGRDAGIYLAHLQGIPTVLCSPTPSIETLWNLKNGKYEGYESPWIGGGKGARDLMNIGLIDLKDQFRRKRMNGNFSKELIEAIEAVLGQNQQVLVFHHRRGYAPVLECLSCGYSVPCPNCDVSLTLHQEHRVLSCHYCGYSRPYPSSCEQCAGSQLSSKGVGSEQVQEKLQELFPNVPIGRMDQETTRRKYGHRQLASDFRQGKYQILVGTQMLIKGLDYSNVGLVGVVQADSLWNIPDYRSSEKAYQLLDQLTRRASRKARVLIQTYQPGHEILTRLLADDYPGLVDKILQERRGFRYPPFVRMIKITIKARSEVLGSEAGQWIAEALRTRFPGLEILGPEPPHVSRVRRWYLRQLLIKAPWGSSMNTIKKGIKRTEASFYAISKFGSVRWVYDVDHL